MISDDMYETLQRFYAWERGQNPADIGYPNITPVRRLLGGSVGSLGLTDDEALHIDKAITELRLERPDEYAVVKRVHRDQKSLRWMESRGEGNRRKNAMLLSNAHQFVSGFLRGANVA